MKSSKITIKLLLITAVLTAVLSCTAAFSAFAEPDETYAIESYVATEASETQEPETQETATEETQTQQLPTEPWETEAQVDDTAAEDTEAVTQAPTEEKTEPTYRAPLPTVEDTEIIPPEVIGATNEKNEPSLFWGFVSWILIGVGAAVIFAVVLSTKAKAYRGGRDRYSSTDKISGKKKLLPQDYYDKRKRR